MLGILWRAPLKAAKNQLRVNKLCKAVITYALSANGRRYMSQDSGDSGNRARSRGQTNPSLLLRTTPPPLNDDETLNSGMKNKSTPEGPNYPNVPRTFRDSSREARCDEEFDLLNFPSNVPKQSRPTRTKNVNNRTSTDDATTSTVSGSVPQRVMTHHLREFKREHPNVTPKQLEAFIKRLEARYGSSESRGGQSKSNHQVSRERVFMNNQAVLSASLAARSGGSPQNQLRQRIDSISGSQSDAKHSVADVRAKRELDLLLEQESANATSRGQHKSGTQESNSAKKHRNMFDESDPSWTYDESYDLMSEESGRVHSRLRGAHGTVTVDGTRILDAHSHSVNEDDGFGEDPELLEFLSKAGQLEGAFEESPFRNYFDHSESKQTKQDQNNPTHVTDTSYVARMKHGEPVYLVGSRRVISSDRSLDETAYIYMVRQIDMRNLHIHDFVLSADFETGMPFEADVYTHLSPERTTGQVIERDESTGEIQHRTFIRLLGSPWKWTGAMAISQVAQSVLQKAQREAKSNNVSYTLSRTRFAPFHHYSEKLIRENGETVLTIFDELQVTSEAQYRGVTKELYESIKETMEEEGMTGDDLESFTTKGGKRLGVLSSLSSEDASLGGNTKGNDDPFDVVNEILLKYKDGGSNGAQHAMKEIEGLPSFMNEGPAQGGLGNGTNGFTQDELRRMDEDLFDPRRSKKSSNWGGDKKKSKRKY